jgi:DNA-directed RNA polymerase subunit RPC12/RpoP
MTCKGMCTKYKTPRVTGSGHYSNGHKRCQICEIFIKHDSLWCPCCGYRLRTKPRNPRYKQILRNPPQKDTGLERAEI